LHPAILFIQKKNKKKAERKHSAFSLSSPIVSKAEGFSREILLRAQKQPKIKSPSQELLKKALH